MQLAQDDTISGHIYSVTRWDYSGAEWHHGRNMAFWRIHKLYFLICKIDRTLRQVVEQLNEIIQVPGAVHGLSISAPCNLDRLW